MFDWLRNFIIEALLLLPGIILAMTVHEFAHAWVSTKLGDPLPRQYGRLSLNPRRHIDPVGFIMLLVLRFGWAKPVYIDPRHYKNQRMGTALVSVAGAAANLITAFVLTFFVLLAEFSYIKLLYAGSEGFGMTMLSVVVQLLMLAQFINVSLGLFNLIPVPPLDGSKLLSAALPLKARERMIKYERYGMLILIILLFNLPGRLLGIVGVPYSITRWLDITFYLGAAVQTVVGWLDAIFIPLVRAIVF